MDLIFFRENKTVDRDQHNDHRQHQDVCVGWSRQTPGGKLSGANQVKYILTVKHAYNKVSGTWDFTLL